jgi:hypothetical protein
MERVKIASSLMEMKSGTEIEMPSWDRVMAEGRQHDSCWVMQATTWCHGAKHEAAHVCRTIL